MKKLLLGLLLLPLGLASQSLTDDFSDGDFTSNPSWTGDQAQYTINANNELAINDLGNTGNSSLYLGANMQDSTVWEFLIKTNLTTSGPSGSNKVRVYLQIDQADVSANLNGYYLEFGESGSNDALELYRITNGSSASLIRGTDGQMAGPNNNVRVRISRDHAGNWELSADYSGGTNFVSEGTTQDNSHNAGSFFAIRTYYSSTQGDRFSYDDISISPLFVDQQAPSLLSASAASATSVAALFDEALDPTTANNAANYSLNNGVTVSAAQIDAQNPNQVNLTVTSMQSQTSYQLTVNNVEDLSGNALSNQSTTFTYVQLVTPAYQDLIFNELMIDPSPVVNLPEAEFIEIYNRGTGAVDLSNYELIHRSASSGTETSRSLANYILLPNEYLILHNDAAYTTASNQQQIPGFPSLNNTSAYLLLKTPAGQLVDSILYSNDWYQDENKDAGGWTLELINPNLVCKGGNNWIASNDLNGGTPGAPNSVLDNTVDTTAPVILQARQASVNQAVLVFDDILDALAATDIANYSIDNGLNVVFAQLLDQYTVELTFNSNMQSQNTYSITANNVGDCVGNLANRTASFVYYEVEAAEHYDILINEILADASPSVGLPELEFVELYNRSNKYINLLNYRFSDGTSSRDAVFPFYILAPGQYLIISGEEQGQSYNSFGPTITFTSFPDLNAGGELISLSAANGNIIDAVDFSSDWYSESSKADGGWTLERINPNRPCEGASNWMGSIAQPPNYATVGGTPGQENSVYQDNPDQFAPDLIRAYPFGASIAANGDSIRLFFSEALDDSTAVNLANFSLDNGLMVQEAYLEAPNYNTLVIITDQGLSANTIYTISLTNGLTDCVGNPIGLINSTQFALPQSIAAGDLQLNEVLFNPATGGSDFVEIYNASEKVLNLGDLWIANTTEESTLLDDANRVVGNLLIFPGSYAVLTEGAAALARQYARPVGQPTPDLSKMLETDLPAYNDDEGTVLIYSVTNNQAVFVDQFDYSEDFHNALLDEVDGVSLERIDLNAPTNDPNNWHSAAQAANFATPTYENSSALRNEVLGQELLELPNNTFSPDGDGFEDFLLINYSLPAPDYVAEVAVYDANGRFIKQLVQSESLLQEGFLQWDGSNEAGEKALVGPYIILAKLVSPSGDTKVEKKTCVLAAKF